MLILISRSDMDSLSSRTKFILFCVIIPVVVITNILFVKNLLSNYTEIYSVGNRTIHNIMVKENSTEIYSVGQDGLYTFPLGGFKGWNDGQVTVLKPIIERNCSKMFEGDKKEITRVQDRNREWKNSFKDEELLKMTEDCTWVKDYFHNNLYTTNLERSFPIAYTFVVYNSPQQVLRLFKLLYRSTNTYCIHPDYKSSQVFTGIFHNLAACLENVIIPSKLVSVVWRHPSLMEAQMTCLRELVDFRSRQPDLKKWNYVINLCGKEVPLKSTHSIISSLAKLNGSSSIMARKVTPNEYETQSRLRHQRIPFNLTYYKSMTYMALSYKFAHFLLTNSTSLKVYDFFKQCYCPEEHYYATLYMIPGVPGGFDPDIPYFHVASILWLSNKKEKLYRCMGEVVHKICIASVGDLKFISEKTALFHNKYFMELDHTIMDCMEERLVEKNKEEFKEDCIIIVL